MPNEKPVAPTERHYYQTGGVMVCPFEEYAKALSLWFDEQLEERDEKHRMQLTAIDVLSLANTRESAANTRLDKDNPYWTPTLGSVCDLVDREIEERERHRAAVEVIRNLVGQIDTFANAQGEADFYTGDALKFIRDTEKHL